MLAGGLIKQALKLIDKNIHPLKIASGFEKACDLACENLDKIASELDIHVNNHENLIKTAMTSLGSKIVSKCNRHLAEITVKAVLAVADMERRDVNFDLIKITPKTGGSIEDTQFIEGLLIDKDFSHPQMEKEVKDAKICILTCPFEPPKLKNKNKITVKNADQYKAMYKQEQQYFIDMI